MYMEMYLCKLFFFFLNKVDIIRIDVFIEFFFFFMYKLRYGEVVFYFIVLMKL